MAKKENGSTVENSSESASALKFKTVRNVTLPLFKMELDTPLYVRITGEMYIGKEVGGVEGKAKMEPATLCHVINLITGEIGQIIINAVVKGIFDDEYSDGAYVGKSFSLEKLTKREGKKYNDFRISEIEVE